MNHEDNQYLTLLAFCLKRNDNRDEVPAAIADINWHDLLSFAKKQAIVGVYAPMLLTEDERLETCQWMGNRPTDDDIMEWMLTTRTLEQKNNIVNEKAAWVAKNFTIEGFGNCLLKGQGNALLYPNPQWRSSGDIDIWVWPNRQVENDNEGKEREKEGNKFSGKEADDDARAVIAYCRRITGRKKKACYHHVDFRKAGDIPIEVHYRPSWLNNPIHNRRLQQWFRDRRDECQANITALGFSMPTWEFNVVFQLCHLYNHLIHEGIGLRQFCDYYYLLKTDANKNARQISQKTLKELGLLTFAQATMWILNTVMGLEANRLICEPDERRGKLVLKEILEGGNFGHFDERTLSGTYQSPVMSNLQRLARDFRLCRAFPSECFWEPWFRIYHWYWRKQH